MTPMKNKKKFFFLNWTRK